MEGGLQAHRQGGFEDKGEGRFLQRRGPLEGHLRAQSARWRIAARKRQARVRTAGRPARRGRLGG